MGLIIKKTKRPFDDAERWVLNEEGKKKLSEFIENNTPLNEIWQQRDSFETRSDEDIKQLKADKHYCDPTLYLMILVQSHRNKKLREEKGIADDGCVNKEVSKAFSKEWNELIVELRKQEVEVYLENANLREAHLENVDLSVANLENANLRWSHLESADLLEANLENADLSVAHLENADLREAHLENARLWRAHLENADLNNAYVFGGNFSDAKLAGAEMTNISFHLTQSYLENVVRQFYVNKKHLKTVFQKEDDPNLKTHFGYPVFNETRFGDAILSVSFDLEKEKPANPKLTYKELRKQAVNCLSKGLVNNVQFVDPVFGREVRDQAWLNHFLKSRDSWFAKRLCCMWGITSDYGRNIWRWLVCSLVLACVFALINFFVLGDSFWVNKVNATESSGVTSESENNVQTNSSKEKTGFNSNYITLKEAGIMTSIYYSVVTFTTLGFGDVIPEVTSTWAKISVILEVVLGYLMLGGLISIFSNKLARRND